MTESEKKGMNRRMIATTDSATIIYKKSMTVVA